jgi:hypothetical protein
MYTNPAFARQGVGRLILTLCEKAAAAEDDLLSGHSWISDA